MSAIRIRPGPDGRLIVHLPYSPERLAKIRTIAGRRWHGPEKHWSVPDEEGALERLKALFAGDEVESGKCARVPEPEAPRLAIDASAPLGRALTAMRTRHLSPRTETVYLAWSRRFLAQAGGAMEDLGEAAVGRFLSGLAVEGQVSASTQNQALNALLFLFEHGLGKKLGLIEGVVRAKRPQRLPVVLSKEEIRRLLGHMQGPTRLMAMLLYGAGLRLMECCRLRVKDLDWDQNQLVVRAGKGDKDRYTTLPAGLREPLQRHLAQVQRLHQEDR